MYKELDRILNEASMQAKEGKGAERHATGEPFENQKICTINRWLRGSSVAGPLFQAAKKIVESAGLEQSRGVEAAIHELRGAVNYIAAAIKLLEEQRPMSTDYSVTMQRCCNDCTGDVDLCQCNHCNDIFPDKSGCISY